MERDPIAVRHESVLAGLTEAARTDDDVVAAWLQGSRADGSADPFSDIDFYVAVADEAYDRFDKLAFIQRVAPVLVHYELPGLPGIVCLLEGPVKLDLFAERVSSLEQGERSAVLVLVDKSDAASKLNTSWEPSKKEIASQVDALVRLTFQGSTWPVRLLRRGQWMTHAYSEIALIHNVILPLMLAQHDARTFHRNPLTRERLLPEEERLELDALARDILSALAARSLAGAYRAHLPESPTC